MLIALFGATGRVGRRLLEYALADGHAVSALARDPSKLPPHERLTALKGDVLDPLAVAQVISGADAVISTLGGAGLEDPGEAQSQGMRNIVAAMQHATRSATAATDTEGGAAGSGRLLGVAGSGILDSIKGGLRHDQPGFLPMFRPVSERHQQAWEAMRASPLEWTMVACPDIIPGERTRTYRTRAERLPEKGASISIEDVADFLMREMLARDFMRQRVGLAY